MEEGGLVYAFQLESCLGFGFQCNEERRCLYIAQVFMPPKEGEHFETELPESALSLVHDFVPRDKIWITDWIGREWVTISIERFNDVERIFNTFLQNGYRVLTHTTPKTEFKPGEVFSRQELDRHMIQTYQVNYDIAKSFIKNERDIPDYLKKGALNIRSLLRPENWATPEGIAFCVKLRETLRKKPFPKATRFDIARFMKACATHGVLFYGGWYKYTPTLKDDAWSVLESPTKKASPIRVRVDEEEEQECMICLERPADTLVLPCGHRVVCDECSKKLRTTHDDKICVRCRREITHVSYAKDNSLETK